MGHAIKLQFFLEFFEININGKTTEFLQQADKLGTPTPLSTEFRIQFPRPKHLKQHLIGDDQAAGQ
jgi:hypothetical protein